MPLRSLVSNPEDLARLQADFEQAWLIIAERQAIDPLCVAAQRERLAHLMVELWQPDGGVELALSAVARFLAEETVDHGAAARGSLTEA